MVRARIAGPRPLLDRTLIVLQDLGVLHVDAPGISGGGVQDEALRRKRRHVERSLIDVETAIERLRLPDDTAATGGVPLPAAAAARRARRVRRRAATLASAIASLEGERALLLRYREFFQIFDVLAGRSLAWPDGQAFYVVLRAGASGALAELTRRLEQALDGEVEVLHRELSTGEWAVLILVSSRAAPKVSALLEESRVEELPAPAGMHETDPRDAMPAINTRLEQIADALRGEDAGRRALAQAEGSWLCERRRFLRDELLRLEARGRVFAADYLFIIEGWLPASRLADLERHMLVALGPEVVMSAVEAGNAAAEAAPVALQNPPLFRPFEVLTQMLPLPKYGTIDPTPFVAIFFPAFFGLMLGDVGYGLMLAALAGLLRWTSQPATTRRSIAAVALACSSSTVAFGLLFGEFFGSLGPAVGLRPFFDRQEAIVPFLALAVALGGVHVMLGLVLAGLTSWRRGRRREAVGRGVALGMMILTALSLLAAFQVLPEGLFTPLVVSILAAFTFLVALEGTVAVIELVSTIGHVLSYARIMALGTASLMLAIVANEMAGALGSVLVGALFALLFHLVNFTIGLFSPTIHALRLHYVEFFGHFFTPGGAEYRPLGHWQPSP
jgi:V/A-type H+-transporting ATPase subunit I